MIGNLKIKNLCTSYLSWSVFQAEKNKFRQIPTQFTPFSLPQHTKANFTPTQRSFMPSELEVGKQSDRRAGRRIYWSSVECIFIFDVPTHVKTDKTNPEKNIILHSPVERKTSWKEGGGVHHCVSINNWQQIFNFDTWPLRVSKLTHDYWHTFNGMEGPLGVVVSVEQVG